MKLPWVSREMYDAKCEELKRSEAERLKLLDRILGVEQQAPDALVDALTRKAEGDEGLFTPLMGPDTPSGLRKLAQHEANKRAGRVTQ